jgi:hypothetical protein
MPGAGQLQGVPGSGEREPMPVAERRGDDGQVLIPASAASPFSGAVWR